MAEAGSPASTTRSLDDETPASTYRSLDHEAPTDDDTPNTMRRNDLSFHAAGDSRDWESSIAAMEAQSETWSDCCQLLNVPFGPLLHCLSFLDGSGLARLEIACPPLQRTCVCESASKATVLAALRRASDKCPCVDTSWKRLAGWIGSPPAWRVLRELHCATAGPKWAWREGWATSNEWPDVSKWFGVRCKRGRVVGLRLFDNGLSGALPRSIGRLSNLRELLVQHNALSGPLPEALGDLARLEALDVSDNSFCGELPASLSRLKRLAYLNCSQNDLTGVVPDLRLLKLEALNLDRNELTGSLDVISRLRNLEVLNASRNLFEGGLPELDRLPRLKACFLGHNRLAGCLSSVDIGGSLVELYVNDNLLDVSELPAAFARLNVCFTARNSVPPPPGPAG